MSYALVLEFETPSYGNLTSVTSPEGDTMGLEAREPRVKPMKRRPYDYVKRCMDITVSLVALILGAPLFLVLALLVRATMGSPVLFSQLRPGLHGKPFRMYKFRTMRDLYDENGRPLPDELRLTPFGRFLRATSLDELPELWNVLRGEMSLVGPRPLLMQYLDRYTPEQRRRHEVRPGITGWAQVNGRNAISWEKKFEYDVWYVDNYSFLLDMKIIALTVLKVFTRDGISADGHATMPEFNPSLNNQMPSQQDHANSH